MTGRKPWSERDKGPWGDGDPDGEAVGGSEPYHDGPGDEASMPPSEDRDDDIYDT